MNRFWGSVDIGPKDNCWNWTGPISGSGSGYGHIFINKKYWRAHRLVWKLTHGVIPKGIHVLHKCDNTRCVNPNHLFLGTHRDNINDMMHKGRQTRGTRTGTNKLSESDVREIRKRAAAGEETVELAKEFGIVTRTAWSVATKRSWKWLDD